MFAALATTFLALAASATPLRNASTCGAAPSSHRGCPSGLAGPDCRFLAVKPTLETDPAGEDADDPTIWVSDEGEENSVVITTAKQGKKGLNVFDLKGKLLQHMPAAKPDNVDVIYNFILGDAEVDLAVSACRDDMTLCVFEIDDGKLKTIPGGIQKLPSGFDPYGSCVYKSRKTNKQYVFVTSKTSELHQYELIGSSKTLEIKLVRHWKAGTRTKTEGCVTDEYFGLLYVSEEGHGLWRYKAEPDQDLYPYLVDGLVENGGNLYKDVEGVSLFHGKHGSGYLIVSAQGISAFNVYERSPATNHKYLLSFVLVADPFKGIDEVTETDGLFVTSSKLGNFKNGLLVVHDDHKTDSTGNMELETTFKYVRWEDIAKHPRLPKAKQLQLNPDYNPRQELQLTLHRPLVLPKKKF